MGEGTPEPARTTTEEPRVEIGGSGEMHKGLPPSRRDDEPCAQTVVVAGDCRSALAAMTAISTIILLLQSQDPYNHNKALKKTRPRTLQAAELRLMKRNASGVASLLFSAVKTLQCPPSLKAPRAKIRKPKKKPRIQRP